MHLKTLSNNRSLKGIRLIHGFRIQPVASAFSNRPLVELPSYFLTSLICLPPCCIDITPRLTLALWCQMSHKAANWWHTLTNAVLLHVQLCGDCWRNKGATERPFGKALPLKIPSAQWKSLSMYCCRAAPYQVRFHLHLYCGGQVNQNGPLRSYC